MLLSKAIFLLGIAVSSALAFDNSPGSGSTLLTKYIEPYSSGEATTISTSWRTREASATTQCDGDDDGWALVSKVEPTQTDAQQTTTIDSTIPEATNVRPNNAIVAHRMAVIASEKWGRFPESPDAETDVSQTPRSLRAVVWSMFYKSSIWFIRLPEYILMIRPL